MNTIALNLYPYAYYASHFLNVRLFFDLLFFVNLVYKRFSAKNIVNGFRICKFSYFFFANFRAEFT